MQIFGSLGDDLESGCQSLGLLASDRCRFMGPIATGDRSLTSSLQPSIAARSSPPTKPLRLAGPNNPTLSVSLGGSHTPSIPLWLPQPTQSPCSTPAPSLTHLTKLIIFTNLISALSLQPIIKEVTAILKGPYKHKGVYKN